MKHRPAPRTSTPSRSVAAPCARWLALLLAAAGLALPGAARAQASDPEAVAAQAVVRAFHDALRLGQVQAVEELLAPDAVILEGGHLESRQDYLQHHLPADIAFAQAVPAELTRSVATVQGDAAWVHSSSVSKGRFRQRDVRLAGAELVVLTRTASGWRIRAIHWSSHTAQ